MSPRPPRRTAWTQQDLRAALEVAVLADAHSPSANAWVIELRRRDLRGAEPLVSSWLPRLEAEALALVTREARWMPGVVTVEVAAADDLHRGQVRVRGQARAGAPSPPPLDRGVTGTPRLELPAGGTAPSGSMAAEGLVREVPLPAGRTVLGCSPDADVRLEAPQVVARHAELVVAEDGSAVTLRDLGTGIGTLVDGVRRASAALHDGSRIQVGEAVLVLRVDPVTTPDRGRQGGGPEPGELHDPGREAAHPDGARSTVGRFDGGQPDGGSPGDGEATDRTSGLPLGVGPVIEGVRRTRSPLWVAVLLMVGGAVLVGLGVALLDGPRAAALVCAIAGVVVGVAGCVQAWRHRLFEDVS